MFLPEGVLLEMSLTKDKFFIDTNVVVYCFNKNNMNKNNKANMLLKEALKTGFGMISFQVIQEFCNVALKKFETPMTIEDCKVFVNKFLYPICAVFPGINLYDTAFDIKAKTGYSFYDSLILSSAVHCECNVIYTEDMQDGQEIMGVKIINPFNALL